MSEIPPPSLEQQAVLDAVQNGLNVIVNSVAGSGKTTTALLLARSNPTKKMLILTYNSRLKSETRVRVETCGLSNLEVHSYHAMGVKYYSENCFRDEGLRCALQTSPRKPLPAYDIIIIDEAQDMTSLLYQFTCKVLSNLTVYPQLVVVGDVNQSIYVFKLADPRYLSFAEGLYKSPRDWGTLKLQISYRISRSMAVFVNEVMLGRNHMLSSSDAPGFCVDYLVGNTFQSVKWIAAKIKKLIIIDGVRPDEIFVLVPSVKSPNPKAPMKVLENMLTEARIPVLVPIDDINSLGEDVLTGKVAFSSFHQAKGLERSYVFLFNFNKNYFQYYGRDLDSTQCPNILYVAATRAKKYLCVIGEENDGEHLQFFRRGRLREISNSYVDANGVLQGPAVNVIQTSPFSGPPAISFSPESDLPFDKAEVLIAHDLTSFLPEILVAKTLSLMPRRRLRAGVRDLIKIATKVKSSDGLVHNVADINGLAIPAILEVDIQRSAAGKITSCTLYSSLESCKSDFPPKLEVLFKTLVKPEEMCLPEHYLKLAAVYQAGAGVTSRGFISRALQLTSFSWIDEETFHRCKDLLKENIEDYKDGSFEVLLVTNLVWGPSKIPLMIQGLIDIETPSALWEIKCVSALSPENFLQIYIYSWLWRRTNPESPRKFFLFNVLNGELWEIESRDDEFDEIIDMLLSHHFRPSQIGSDEEFMRKNQMALTNPWESFNRNDLSPSKPSVLSPLKKLPRVSKISMSDL